MFVMVPIAGAARPSLATLRVWQYNPLTMVAPGHARDLCDQLHAPADKTTCSGLLGPGLLGCPRFVCKNSTDLVVSVALLAPEVCRFFDYMNETACFVPFGCPRFVCKNSTDLVVSVALLAPEFCRFFGYMNETTRFVPRLDHTSRFLLLYLKEKGGQECQALLERVTPAATKDLACVDL